MDGADLLVYMLENDIALQTAMEYYCGNYRDCELKYTNNCDMDMDADRNLLTHMQQFLYDCSMYYLTLGFVVFRFTKLPFSKNGTLVPIAIPIHDIEWEYDDADYSMYRQMPAVSIRSRGLQDDSLRFYVYKFRCNLTPNSRHSTHGILYRLVHIFRRLVHAQDYDLLLRNETLRKTVFVEQTVRPEKEVSLKVGSERGELQAIMDNVRQQRITTDHPLPLTQNDEFRSSITVHEDPPPFPSSFCTPKGPHGEAFGRCGPRCQSAS